MESFGSKGMHAPRLGLRTGVFTDGWVEETRGHVSFRNLSSGIDAEHLQGGIVSGGDEEVPPIRRPQRAKGADLALQVEIRLCGRAGRPSACAISAKHGAEACVVEALRGNDAVKIATKYEVGVSILGNIVAPHVVHWRKLSARAGAGR